MVTFISIPIVQDGCYRPCCSDYTSQGWVTKDEVSSTYAVFLEQGQQGQYVLNGCSYKHSYCSGWMLDLEMWSTSPGWVTKDEVSSTCSLLEQGQSVLNIEWLQLYSYCAG